MVFSTHLFLFAFLPLCLLLYYVTPRPFRSLVLTLLSFVFYGWANPAWALLMLLSIVLDYSCGLLIARGSPRIDHRELAELPKGTRRRLSQKLALAASIVGNLTILGFFKYFDFTAQNLNRVAELFGGEAAVPLLQVALPVGISFYTFQTMSYTIDVFRGDGRALRNPIEYACYVSMFPQLVAGPVVRYHDIGRQIGSRTHTWEKFARGSALFCLGLAKKILLANPMGDVADAAFSGGALSTLDAWFGAFAYAFQIYFDFSAYSDMAVGIGLMFGFVFIKNFDSPYHAASITEFWRRWHISLSTWLRDYLYIPLGGNRAGTSRTYANLIIVMLLGGFWHGASWTFIIWGGIHGGMLAIERAAPARNFFTRIARPVRIAATFVTVTIGWIFFRSESLADSLHYIGICFGARNDGAAAVYAASLMYTPYHLLVFGLCGLVTWGLPQAWNFTQRLTPARVAAALLLFALSILFMWTQSVNPFLYFRF